MCLAGQGQLAVASGRVSRQCLSGEVVARHQSFTRTCQSSRYNANETSRQLFDGKLRIGRTRF